MYRRFLLALVAASLLLLALILRPFLHTIILAILLAALSRPLMRRFERLLPGRPSLASLCVLGVVLFLIVIPLSAFLLLVTAKAIASLNSLVGWVRGGGLENVLADPRIAPVVERLRTDFDINLIGDYLAGVRDQLINLGSSIGQFALSYGAGLVGVVGEMIADFFIMAFILFYLIRDGGPLVEKLKALSPLRSEQEDVILDRIEAVAKSVVYGGFLTAACQGLAGGIGLAVAGIQPFFWGMAMTVASFIPVVGVALVWVPAAIYLFAIGNVGMGVFLTLWSVLVVGTIDNFLRPFFMRGRADLSPFFIFLAILGGIATFGFKGLVYGPLILAFAAVMLSIYQEEFSHELAEAGAGRTGMEGMSGGDGEGA